MPVFLCDIFVVFQMMVSEIGHHGARVLSCLERDAHDHARVKTHAKDAKEHETKRKRAHVISVLEVGAAECDLTAGEMIKLLLTGLSPPREGGITWSFFYSGTRFSSVTQIKILAGIEISGLKFLYCNLFSLG